MRVNCGTVVGTSRSSWARPLASAVSVLSSQSWVKFAPMPSDTRPGMALGAELVED